jgi:hypothetical protein
MGVGSVVQRFDAARPITGEDIKPSKINDLRAMLPDELL